MEIGALFVPGTNLVRGFRTKVRGSTRVNILIYSDIWVKFVKIVKPCESLRVHIKRIAESANRK